ncbi:15225_t:CDS:2, partial [Acaulospora morrowiae]
MDSSFVPMNSAKFIVPHVLQEDSFDCGLACVCMILKALGFVNLNLWEVRNKVIVSSIWTIDLAFLLRNYLPELDFTFYTAYAGARVQYKNDKFYRSSFDEDENRVNRLFSIAKNSNIKVIRMVLPLEDFKRFLSNSRFAIIALVNAKLLDCQRCQEARRICCVPLCNNIDSLVDTLRGHDYV